MSDEPVEDADSGSDGAGASSSSGSDDPDSVEESSPAGDSAIDEQSSTESANDADAEDADDDADAEDADDDADAEDTALDQEPTDSDDGTGFQFLDDAREAVTDAAEDAEESAASSGRPGYTDDHVTASADDAADDDSPGGDSSSAEGAQAADDPTPETDPADHAPVGTQAPSPDEGPTTSVTDTAGAGTAGGGGGDGGSSILSGGIGGTAPPDDEEMPLTEHIEEMLTRLAIVVVVASLATLAVFPFANDVIIHMWYDVHGGSVEACRTAPQSDGCVAPHVYGPLELVLTRIRVAGLVGLLVALPLAVYQIYRFMRPGLYPHERRYYLAAVPFSLVLGILGMTFAYFVLLPLLFEYFITYTEGSADLAFQLAETMNLVLMMMGMLAIIFQIPLLMMLAIMMGITTRQWLERRRLYFWGLFLGVAVIFGPDPTGMAPFLLTATMVALFEGTLLLLRWTGR